MKNRHSLKIFILLFLQPFLHCACNGFLDEKSDYSLSTPESLEDLRALLDNEALINQNYPGLMETGTDDYYVDENQLAAAPAYLQDLYIWSANETATDLASWTKPYEAVMVSNVVLESIVRIGEDDTALYRQVLGEASFVRGFYLFYLAQIFCMPYGTYTGNEPMGIPLKYSADITEKVQRASLHDTYLQIISDMRKATVYLPVGSAYKTRPTKAAAYAALSRIYLSMADYTNAAAMADTALYYQDLLLDYNILSTTATYPFKVDNPEMIYSAYSTTGSALLLGTGTFVDREFYDSYHADDLRKSVYFTENPTGTVSFKGYYAGVPSTYFAGLSVDELYLTKSECLARSGQIGQALVLLNKLLETRWKSGAYTLIGNMSQAELLDRIFEERRKELIFRGVRWLDIRRRNRFDGAGIMLRRAVIEGGDEHVYGLPANDNRFAYPIPLEVLSMNHIEQNPR